MGLMKAVEKFEYRRGYKVLDLRDVVDPTGHHAFDRRSGPHDPHSRAYIETINKLIRVQKQLVQEYGASLPGRGRRGNSIARSSACALFSRWPSSRSRSRRRSAIATTRALETSRGQGRGKSADQAAIVLLKDKIKDVLDTLTSASARCSSSASVLWTATAARSRKWAASSRSLASASARSRRRRSARCATRPVSASSRASSSRRTCKTLRLFTSYSCSFSCSLSAWEKSKRKSTSKRKIIGLRGRLKLFTGRGVCFCRDRR